MPKCKHCGSDAKNKKSTFVSKYGIEKCREIAADLSKEAKELLTQFGGDPSVLVDGDTVYFPTGNYLVSATDEYNAIRIEQKSNII